MLNYMDKFYVYVSLYRYKVFVYEPGLMIRLEVMVYGSSLYKMFKFNVYI